MKQNSVTRARRSLAELLVPGYRQKRRLRELERGLAKRLSLMSEAAPFAKSGSDAEHHLLRRMDEQLLTLHNMEKVVSRAAESHANTLRMALSLNDKLVNLPGQVSSGPLDISSLRDLARELEISGVDLDGQQIEFLGHPLYFEDLFSVYVVFKEVYLYEDYFADLDTDEPRILDCGAHIGMAALYFLNLYPKAQVICFEPDPNNFSLLERNTAHHGASVTRHELAISADGASYTLAQREGQSMATSLYERSSAITTDAGIEVKSTKLSEYLDEPVDFLKLDIEGAEDGVLDECRDKLGNVNFLFIEFHTGDGLPLSRLRKILEILDEAGFDYQIERAREYQVRMMHRPFTHLNQLCTHVLHAKNGKFKQSK